MGATDVGRIAATVGHQGPQPGPGAQNVGHRKAGLGEELRDTLEDVIHVGGLGGELAIVALLRSNGLHRAVAKHDGVLHLVNAGWRIEDGAKYSTHLLEQDPELTVLWAANDYVALGALETLQQQDRKPGQDIVLGGIDWEPRALGLVEQGVLTTSIGGHVLDGLWALLLLYDHHHGFDFTQVSSRSSWGVAARETASIFLKLFQRGSLRRVDLRQFSVAQTQPGEPSERSVNALLPLL